MIFPQGFYEYSLLKFADKAIVDTSSITGHYGVYSKVFIGPCEVSGVIHPGTYLANASLISSKEAGPMRSFVGINQGEPGLSIVDALNTNRSKLSVEDAIHDSNIHDFSSESSNV